MTRVPATHHRDALDRSHILGKYYDDAIIPDELRRNFDVYDRVSELGIDLGSQDEIVTSLAGRNIAGAVFHESFLRPELSLEENLKFSASLRGLRWNDVAATATSLLDRLGLSRRRQDTLSTFSQGMTRRADLIRSLLHRPELWILDEPFAGLDAGGCELLETMIREYVQKGRTVLLVTHRTALGERLAGGGAALEDGRVVTPRAESPAATPQHHSSVGDDR